MTLLEKLKTRTKLQLALAISALIQGFITAGLLDVKTGAILVTIVTCVYILAEAYIDSKAVNLPLQDFLRKTPAETPVFKNDVEKF